MLEEDTSCIQFLEDTDGCVRGLARSLSIVDEVVLDAARPSPTNIGRICVLGRAKNPLDEVNALVSLESGFRRYLYTHVQVGLIFLLSTLLCRSSFFGKPDG